MEYALYIFCMRAVEKTEKLEDIVRIFSNIGKFENAIEFSAQLYKNNVNFVKNVLNLKIDFKEAIKTVDKVLNVDTFKTNCFEGNIEILKLIIPFVNPEKISKGIIYATICERFDIIEYLYPFSEKNRKLALIESCKKENTSIAEFLLEKGVYCNKAFFKAIKYNQVEIIKRMIFFGKYKEVHYRGTTPIHYSILYDSVETFDLLIDLCDPNSRDYRGETPLYSFIKDDSSAHIHKFIPKLITISDCDACDKTGVKMIDRILELSEVPDYFEQFLEKMDSNFLNRFLLSKVIEAHELISLGSEYNTSFIKIMSKKCDLNFKNSKGESVNSFLRKKGNLIYCQ